MLLSMYQGFGVFCLAYYLIFGCDRSNIHHHAPSITVMSLGEGGMKIHGVTTRTLCLLAIIAHREYNN